MNENIFKAYDIRGIFPTEINEKAVYKIAQAYGAWLKPKKVAVGRDVRNSGEILNKSVIEALIEMGIDVVDIGVATTDMLYFAVAHYKLDGGICVTASHNSAEYNGLKLVREKASPVSLDSGLDKIRDLVRKNEVSKSENKGEIEQRDVSEDYLAKVLSFIEKEKIKPMKVVANPNFGASGKIVEKIAEVLKIDLIKLNFEQNGNFPKGKPDPLMLTNQKEISELVKKSRADFGVAWDADADRCFFFDEKGSFIPAYYTTAILAKIVLKGNRGSVVVQDPRLVWASRDAVLEMGGATVRSKAGRSFIGETMRKEDAIFAGEISGHYFFRDFFACDNGIIPFLIMLQYLSETEQTLSEVTDPYFKMYPISGELNFKVNDVNQILEKIKAEYRDGELDDIDGISISFDDWRFNIRSSNTEPLLRLNVEAIEKKVLDEKVTELTKLIEE